MKTFTIENETNNITLHASAKEAEALPDSERFGSEATLAKIAANWPAARLTEIWNSLPGETPVKKFKDRATAVSRIWKAIQDLGQPAPVLGEGPVPVPGTVPEMVISGGPEPVTATAIAPQKHDVASEAAPAKNKPNRAKNSHTPTATKGTQESNKTEIIVALIKQPGGTTLKAIMDVTNWQAHSVRGFISGTLGKKMGLAVVSTKGENRERRYSISA